jgi:hypothetical protein
MLPQTTRHVVVGEDGTPRTVAALRWAATGTTGDPARS